jgi:hypothetical protein
VAETVIPFNRLSLVTETDAASAKEATTIHAHTINAAAATFVRTLMTSSFGFE